MTTPTMEDLSRAEYPAMLASLQPNQAVQIFSDRVKRISKVNQEIADWLQERRKVEEQYVASLRKLLLFKVPNGASELGVFQAPWDKILSSTDAIAASHQLYAQRIDKDVEQPLRSFQSRKEMQNITTINSNLHAMAKELDDAAEKSEKLSKKGGKANSQKVDAAAARLEAASQQWESQAPFIFETLQALDEQRTNHIRDVLTQWQTHEVDQATRTQAAAEEVLNTMLEVNTGLEIHNFVTKATAGRPKIDRRTTTARQSSSAGGGSPAVGPPPGTPLHDDDGMSQHSGFRDQPDSKLRSRIGTMLGRRRQSIHGGFGQLGPPKSLGSFTRGLGSSHGQTLSPRGSSHNLAESQNNRLSSLAERPSTSDERMKRDNNINDFLHNGTNGFNSGDRHAESNQPRPTSNNLTNGTAEDIFDATPSAPPAPNQQSQSQEEPAKDAEGYTIPQYSHDPIAEAQKEANAEEPEHLFKLNIQNEPIAEEDQDAKQAALSNVAHTLTAMGLPNRKAGTVRGRRDVRHTMYMPTMPVPEHSENPFPSSPSLPATASSIIKPTPPTTLGSEPSHASHASDNQSIRSGTSYGAGSAYGGMAHLKHQDIHGSDFGPGLHSSIIETVSALFQDGEAKSVKVVGEIALSYKSDPHSLQNDNQVIRLNNFARLESIGPNRLFVTSDATSPDEFTINTSHLTTISTPAFTYRVHAENDTALVSTHCPIAISPVWKPQGDKLGLLLQYRLNPAVTLQRPIVLHNVTFVATYEGARASGVQTKPSGTHLKDKHLVYWRIPELTLTDDWAKIICRVIGEQNAEPQPGHIEVRWEYTAPAAVEVGSGISVSRLVEGKGKEKAEEQSEEEDPFADDKGPISPALVKDGRNWVDVPLSRKLISGKYEAK
ncbi:Muniscin C-terminal mu homology domain-containing protein [Sordaria brevicollis]|uniref:Muniscin C-terminal mu homology domain-containing protein n=1 Tax=Sordaria brevicollis TaxID=83679 RepID=A0AAE0PHP6_SORBR|nr:Muniscin C-terminal mu homology domain-containing protein [Sordaria brevicollis]